MSFANHLTLLAAWQESNQTWWSKAARHTLCSRLPRLDMASPSSRPLFLLNDTNCGSSVSPAVANRSDCRWQLFGTSGALCHAMQGTFASCWVITCKRSFPSLSHLPDRSTARRPSEPLSDDDCF